MQFPISIELRRSQFYRYALSLLHALAALSVYLLPWHGVWRGMLVMMLGVSLYRALTAPTLSTLYLLSPQRIAVQYRDDERRELVVLPNSTVFPVLIVLRARFEDHSTLLTQSLFPDQMQREEFRLLSLCLRAQAHHLGAQKIDAK